MAEMLRQRMEKYLATVDAQLPADNPSYDPRRPAPPAKGKRGGRNRTDLKNKNR